MAAEVCLAQIHALMLRVGLLDDDGSPLVGADMVYTSSALVLITLSPQYAEGEEIEVRNGSGALCINFKEPDTLKRVNFDLQICSADPYLHSFLTGGALLEDGDAIGFAAPELGVDPVPNGVSLEAWARRIGSDGAPDPDFPYAHWAMPRAYPRLGDRSLARAAQEQPFSGHMIENHNWGNGPGNDWPEASLRAFQWIPTDALPTADCGPQVAVAS